MGRVTTASWVFLTSQLTLQTHQPVTVLLLHLVWSQEIHPEDGSAGYFAWQVHDLIHSSSTMNCTHWSTLKLVTWYLGNSQTERKMFKNVTWAHSLNSSRSNDSHHISSRRDFSKMCKTLITTNPRFLPEIFHKVWDFIILEKVTCHQTWLITGLNVPLAWFMILLGCHKPAVMFLSPLNALVWAQVSCRMYHT